VIEVLTRMWGWVRVAERHILDSYNGKQLVPFAQNSGEKNLQFWIGAAPLFGAADFGYSNFWDAGISLSFCTSRHFSVCHEINLPREELRASSSSMDVQGIAPAGQQSLM